MSSATTNSLPTRPRASEMRRRPDERPCTVIDALWMAALPAMAVTMAVNMTFAKGALLKDSSGIFNASLEGNTRRAIDFHEGDAIDEKALIALVRAAVALNTSA